MFLGVVVGVVGILFYDLIGVRVLSKLRWFGECVGVGVIGFWY